MHFFKLNNNINKYHGQNKAHKIVVLGVLLSMTLILNYITNFLQWPEPSFLHLDFSLIPIIVALFIFNFYSSFLLLIIRFFLELLLSHDGIAFWYGPLIQLQISLFFILFIIISFKTFNKIVKSFVWLLFISLLCSSFLTIIFSSIINWSWATPLYMHFKYNYNGSINPFSFNQWYIKNNLKIMFLGLPNWHVASFGIFIPFNIVKFSMISFVSIILIKISYRHFYQSKS